MPKKSEEKIPLRLKPEWTEKIAALAELAGCTYEEMANEVINEILEVELPRILARRGIKE